MNATSRPIFIGETVQQQGEPGVKGEYVSLHGERFFKISGYDAMPPFFMSLVSSSNHWLFIASTGGLAAGRVNAERALFPYYTVDKLSENNENTGAKAMFLVERAGKTHLWEPFSQCQRGVYAAERNLYKNVAGTTLIFEEINRSLELTYRYAWRSGDAFGFVKSGWLLNDGPAPCRVEVLDGLQNLLPANVSEWTQTALSPLLDAYKRNELNPTTGLGIYTLNSSLTDLAEPSESLLASVVWQVGLDATAYLLSSRQLDVFRAGHALQTETEVRGVRGAYFVNSIVDLAAGAGHSWHLAADVAQDAAASVRLRNLLQGNRAALSTLLEKDLADNTANLERIVAGADGLQVSQNKLLTAHHFSNVMFNEMRGGYFPDQYGVHSADFVDYVAALDRRMLVDQAAFFSELPDFLSIDALHARAEQTGSEDLTRLANAYLPLSFSRRHGDPSRPWNRFSINIKKKDGSQQYDYEGNWRDIFQNWEALAYSYPEYTEGMIFAFLNATTADGYNPYRITRRGIDWETPEPNNPWANIGYWSDHQIIYLLKLMEISVKMHPGRLQSYLSRPSFSYANVPYRIKSYVELQRDSFNTITFDRELDRTIKKRVQEQGGDGKLVQSPEGKVLHAALLEKLLSLLLAKLVNFVPEGGIWMNTQRPEWNDANNALVGKGLSVVTLAYLRRYVVFMRSLLQQSGSTDLAVRAEVGSFFAQVGRILKDSEPSLQGGFTPEKRRALLDELGQAGSDYRWNYYEQGFAGQTVHLALAEVIDFLDRTLHYCDHTLRANRRSDGLYHAYNILHLEPGVARIGHLYEMLEGQVAILSSGLLDGAESLALLKSLRSGALFRSDQHSYILYPDREVKGFIERNSLPAEQVAGLALVTELTRAGDDSLLVRDENGDFHFAGHLRNHKDVKRALEALKRQPRFADLAAQDGKRIETLFESTFHHDQFTGRSGTFFAYEGLGSIYWHMVSKLLLAVEETILRTRNEPSLTELLDCYADIRAGQCFNKSPAEYGAFPTDPYSHTPRGQGAKQPGMTGMVKEEILARQVELGFTVADGCIVFDLLLFNRGELLKEPSTYRYLDISGQSRQIDLPAGSLAYSICQVPVVLREGARPGVMVHQRGGVQRQSEGNRLDAETSRHIFRRDGEVERLEVSVSGIE
nr:beta-1,3-oligoglucan phosphorylase [uncultured bacterium]QCO92814.1 beta-1,3-oligoglucan phosphorylase [uncultured bacterium]QCO92866.1 beta-1,3-oligoglucan phosphorylase [uncultured bacterium]QCO92903.1 beta-1,3-oligoglucan phosphorylase [uncultured bacterium]QCO92933.1 beta-1,3-oligoglucan phosphorylase [uncultured bacterium]